MLIDYRRTLDPAERKRLDAIKEVLKDIEPQVEVMFNQHIDRSKRWYPHEILPWGKGIDFNEVPWEQGQSILRPNVVTALETNLLTEDNLPYYHAQIEKMFDPGTIWERWNRRWTAEEGGHAAAIRDYLYLVRAMNPVEIEDNRLMMMESGFDREFKDPLEIFAYTSAQELATRISHLRAGKYADEPTALKLLTLISRDENFHYIFYRGVCAEVLARTPELILPAIVNQFYSFEMPGTGMTNFELRKAMIADAGIYGAREHKEQVIMPLLSFWGIDKLTGLSPEGQKYQERILRLEKLLDRMIERQESRSKKSDDPYRL